MGKKSNKPAASEIPEQQESTDSYQYSATPITLNKWDANKVKQTIDGCIERVMTDVEGSKPDNTLGNWRIWLGVIASAFALFAQFFPKPFPANWNILAVCVVGYCCCQAGLQLLVSYFQQATIFELTQADGTKLTVSSTLGPHSDAYLLEVHNAKSKTVQRMQQSVTRWITKDGVVLEKLLVADVRKFMAKKSR
eukprot:TRINITY_DN15031_c0_g1_i1.p1 TRINITY_DN15031_c0_g1~~TRINITY_DN15031_c0_g1_i1.p1  ORF type:complete len:207 (-),score=35.62 TRINITY_DN15031_c0_g1_i1:18-599(-)